MQDKIVCRENECTGCMACVDICPTGAITIKDSVFAYHAVINQNKCIQCGRCNEICVNNNPVQLNEPVQWQEGWITDEASRKKAASGGVATALAQAFLSVGVVCSCAFVDGEFRFKIAETLGELEQFAGSKYVKSNPSGAYKIVMQKLKESVKVLFIGLPCQIAAVKRYVGEKYQRNLYTVDLVCHGTPSQSCLEDYLEQYGVCLKDIDDIAFRYKSCYGLDCDRKTLVCQSTVDPYLTAFLNALNYTESCYQCKYAQLSRVGDITIADSWGSVLPIEERKRGISLILCQNAKGAELLERAELKLFPADKERQIATHPQLQHPNAKTEKVRAFYKSYGACSFNRNVLLRLPKKRIRQWVRLCLYKAGMKKLLGGGIRYQIHYICQIPEDGCR